jgi:hypothetical protein
MASARPPENPVARQLHIKLGVVQRTQKELAAYHAELIANRDKVAAMRARGADEYDIKKQVRGRARPRARRALGEQRRGRGVTRAHPPTVSFATTPHSPHPTPAQVEVLGETETMIPDTMRRLARGTDDLRAFVAASGGDAAVAGSDALAAARAVLAAADAVAGAGGAGAEEDDEEAI